MARPKGSQNLFTKELKQAIQESFHELGGKEWLKQLATTSPKSYAAILTKMLPAQVEVEAGDNLSDALAKAQSRILGADGEQG